MQPFPQPSSTRTILIKFQRLIKFQTSVSNLFPLTTAITGYAIVLQKLSANYIISLQELALKFQEGLSQTARDNFNDTRRFFHRR